MSAVEAALAAARKKLEAASRQLVDGNGDALQDKAARDAARRELAAAEDAARLTRAGVKAMTTAEFDERHDEIMRWTQAGAKDGELAPPAERPADHVFSRAEIGAMSVEDYDRHQDRIFEQMRSERGIPKASEVDAA